MLKKFPLIKTLHNSVPFLSFLSSHIHEWLELQRDDTIDTDRKFLTELNDVGYLNENEFNSQQTCAKQIVFIIHFHYFVFVCRTHQFSDIHTFVDLSIISYRFDQFTVLSRGSVTITELPALA